MRELAYILMSIFIVLIFVNQSYAYIDPGTGSMLVQAVLAAIAAVSVSIGVFWRRIRSFLDRLFGRNRNE
jgi:hypothetical protein